MLGLECSTVCSTDVDVDADRQKKIPSEPIVSIADVPMRSAILV